MSADDGYLLRRNSENMFVLHWYVAGTYMPSIEDGETVKSKDLEEVLLKYEACEREYPSEHGLLVYISKISR